MIIGGGKTGFYLAEKLSEFGAMVKLVEKNMERCRYLSTHLSNVMILHSDGTDLPLSLIHISLTSSFIHNFEVGGRSTSKAEALRWLMRRLGVSADELMAVGDSPNDEEMIKLAGLGVAVANARESTKETADCITASNQEDGVAKAIEKFVLRDSAQ